jgi:hypothetical protein
MTPINEQKLEHDESGGTPATRRDPQRSQPRNPRDKPQQPPPQPPQRQPGGDEGHGDEDEE